MRHALAICSLFALIAAFMVPVASLAAVSSAGDVNPVPPAGGGNVLGPFVIGNTGTGSVTVNNGTALTNSSNAIVGDAATGIGVVNLTGLGSDWSITTVGSDLFVGDAGVGSISIADGARLTVNDDAFLGVASTAVGEVIVADLGSFWQVNDDMTIGQSGLAVIDILDGGQASAQTVVMGSNATGEGRVTISGILSRWSLTGGITVGSSGIANLQVLNGGRFFSTVSTTIGEFASSVGVAEVSGASSFWEIGGTTITIGGSGSGALRILNGGRATAATSVMLGFGSTATGELLIDGSNSRFTITGGLTTNIGEAAITISNGGILTTTASSTVAPTSRLTLDGGRWESAATGAAGISGIGVITGSGTLDVAGLTLANTGSFRGRVETHAGDHLLLTGALTSAGVVDLDGGEFEIRISFTNTHQIALRDDATLRVGGLGLSNSNGSQLAVTDGNADIFGTVSNNVGAQIAVVGGATAVFHDVVTNNGTIFVSPGSEISLLEDLDFGAASSLNIALGAADEEDPTQAFGQASTTAALALDGALNVSLTNGFAATLGDTFQILSAAGGRSNTFDVETLPSLSGNLALDVLYTATAVTLAVVPELDGDYNANGTVDAADYTVWRDTFGQTALGLPADGNRDGTINTADYNLWKANFGDTLGNGGASGPTPVPEPSTWFLFALAASLVTRVRYRRGLVIEIAGS
jgi:T5SS/PEP-CTERM-associated repeat protein